MMQAADKAKGAFNDPTKGGAVPQVRFFFSPSLTPRAYVIVKYTQTN